MKIFKIIVSLLTLHISFSSCVSSGKKVDLIKNSFEIIQNDPNFMKHWLTQNEQFIVHSVEFPFILDKIKGYHPGNYNKFSKWDFSGTDIDKISNSMFGKIKTIDEKSAYERMNENSENCVFFFFSDIYCLSDTCIVSCGIMKSKRSGIPATFRYLLKNNELIMLNYDPAAI
jgi:hypothetical protein